MLVKNTSKGILNLKSGSLKPGEEGDANLQECVLLFANNRIEEVKPKTRKKKVKDDG